MTGNYKTFNDENDFRSKENTFRMKRRSEQKSFYNPPQRYADRTSCNRLGVNNHKPSQQPRKVAAADSTGISGRPGSRYMQPLASGLSNINR